MKRQIYLLLDLDYAGETKVNIGDLEEMILGEKPKPGNN